MAGDEKSFYAIRTTRYAGGSDLSSWRFAFAAGNVWQYAPPIAYSLRVFAAAWKIFSPRLDPGIGGCEPDCAACGHVCPGQTLQPLTLAQKRWAKTGTAVIDEKTVLHVGLK